VAWSSSRLHRLPVWLPCAVAVALGCAVHLVAIDNPFVYDDLVTVVGNPSLRDPGNVRALLAYTPYRPLVNLSYAADYALWGLEPRGFHLSGILLHLLNVVLLWAVARRLVLDAADRGAPHLPGDATLVLAAGTAAVLFAVHPLMTEAVGYVSGRTEPLCGVFLLGAFLALRAFLIEGRRIWLAVGLGSFLVAAASKEVAGMLPFLLVAWDFLLGPQGATERRRRLLRFHLPFLLLVVVAGVIRVASYVTVEAHGQLVNLWHNALTEVVVAWRYLRLLVLPYGQSIVHDVPSLSSLADLRVLAAIGGVVLVGWTLVRLCARYPLAVFGLLWFALLLAPSHVIPLAEAMAEHRVYTPSLGLFVAAGAGLAWVVGWWQRSGRTPQWSAALVLVAMVVGLSGLTVARYRAWADPVSLWSDAARKAPNTWATQYSLGNALRAAGRCQEAIAPYRSAVAILPEQAESRLNLGICLAQTGELEEAFREFSAARDLEPDNPRPHNNLGSLMATAGRYAEARDHFNEALRVDPGNVPARQALARLAETVFNDPRRALGLCRELQKITPSTPEVEECIRRNLHSLERLERTSD